MKKGLYAFYILWLVLKLSASYAQDTLGRIQALHQRDLNQIQLRWAPSSPLIWQLANQYGYQITRYQTIPQSDSILSKGEVLNNSPIRPWPENRLNQEQGVSDWIGVVQAAIYPSESQDQSNNSVAAGIIDNYQENQNRYAFLLMACDLSLDAAQAAGLYWEDTTSIQEGISYVYQISLHEPPPGQVILPAVLYVDASKTRSPLPPLGLQAQLEGNVAHLSWPTDLHYGVYSQYTVERSADSINFTQIQEVPYAFIQNSEKDKRAYFLDTLPNFETNYYYRIRGISPFQKISAPSEIVKLRAIPDLKGLAILDSTKLNSDGQVDIYWSFPDTLESYINGFQIQKTTDPVMKGTVLSKDLISPKQRYYGDSLPSTSNYYTLLLIGQDNQVISKSPFHFTPVSDTISPLPPNGIQAEINAEGQVNIQWLENREPDLLGYRVFVANHPHAEFVERTQSLLSLPQFQDSILLNTLSPNIYYKILAVDRHYNVSGFSEVVAVQKPDTIPPVAPLFISTAQDSSFMQIRWQNSPSSDVSRLGLYRKYQSDSTWELLQFWNDSFPSSYREAVNFARLEAFQYKLAVYDLAENQNAQTSRWIRVERRQGPAPKPFSLKAFVDGKYIRLDWTNPKKLSVWRSTIYRKVGNGPYLSYQVLNGNTQGFQDEFPPSPGNDVYYKVMLELEEENQRISSEELMIRY